MAVMAVVHYLNGEFVTEDKLLISPRDLGFIRGYAVFDFLRTYNGHKPFMLDWHVDRLFNSAEAINLELPWTKKEIKDIIFETLEKNDKSKEFALRVVVSGGVSSAIQPKIKPTLIIILDEAVSFPEKIYAEGIKLRTISHQRITPEIKTTHYIEAMKNIHTLYAEGFDELLYVNRGNILEGAFSNFFCLINGILVTPKNNVLHGITRKIILEKLALGVDVSVRNLKLNELQYATEAFISVSGKGIVPVVAVDQIVIGNGKIGPITKKIMDGYVQFTKK